MSNEKKFFKNLQPFLNCKDYLVSGETYEVMIHKKYEMLITSPVPIDLENYYKTDNYISHTDSKKSLFNRVYQTVRKRTLKNKIKLLNSFSSKGKSILDVGAGTGSFLKVCKNNNWDIFGVEPNAKAREIARDKNVFLDFNFNSFKEKQFDVITLWHVLEHVPDLTNYIKKLKSFLKEEGRLVIAVPNYKSHDAHYYNEFWAGYDVPRHLWHFSQTSINKLFLEIDMVVEKTYPMKYDAYYISLLSEKNKSGKMKVLKSLRVAYKSNLKAEQTNEYSSLTYVLKNK